MKTKTAEQILKPYKSVIDGCYYVAYPWAEKACEEYADQYKSKWIPVAEKLPDLNENIESDYVVCFSEFAGQFIGWYNGQTKIWVAAIYTSNNNEISHVTHWKLKDADPE